MRATGLRLPLLASLILALAAARARADEVLFIETVDWVPTASVLTVPTSSLLATTAVLPTSYLIPTAYSTAYVLETAYAAPVTVLEPTYYETRFRRRGLFGRRLVETTRAYYMPTTAYYPTTYYYPTVFTAPAVVDRVVRPTEYVATTASACCGELVTDAPVVVRSAPVDRPASSAPRTAPPARPSRIESEPDDESISSDVEPARPSEPPPSKPAPARAAEPRGSEVSPPPPQAAPREKSTAPRPDTGAPATSKGATAPAGATSPVGPAAQPKSRAGGPAPTAPGGDLPEVTPAEDDQLFPAPDKDAASKSPGTVRRDNLRPVLPAPRTIRSEYRNVLVGIVRSRSTDDPEDNVRITLTNRNDPAEERVALTNAFGKFAVRVPDGDWTVKVTMPSGRVYPVSRITVDGGMIFDESGRDVPSLIITR